MPQPIGNVFFSFLSFCKASSCLWALWAQQLKIHPLRIMVCHHFHHFMELHPSKKDESCGRPWCV